MGSIVKMEQFKIKYFRDGGWTDSYIKERSLNGAKRALEKMLREEPNLIVLLKKKSIQSAADRYRSTNEAFDLKLCKGKWESIPTTRGF